MDRVIFHCDLNSFYASVELLSHPELRHLPVAVCGDPASRHGIILAKNEPAKIFQVKTAETIWQAKKKCPGLVLLPAHHGLYQDFSRKVNSLYQEYTDLVEPFGIDESWLDVTGTLHLFGGDGAALANRLRDEVRSRFGLTISVGVSFNKVFAKLGSDYKKPDATTVISPENWRSLLYPLPVTDLLFVGRAAAAVLERLHIRTIGQLSMADADVLEAALGKQGRQLHQYANGLDRSPVRPYHLSEPIKSVGNSTTYARNLTTREEVRSAIALLSDSVAMRLRRHGLYCAGVQVGIKDPQFKNISRQKQLGRSTHLMRDISAAAMELIDAAWKYPSPIRLLSVTAIHLTEAAETFEQHSLFETAAEAGSEKLEKIERTVDAIRGKFGAGVIGFGGSKDPL